MRISPPVILPSIPTGGLQAAETHAIVRGLKEFQIIVVNDTWTVALEKWSGNSPKTPWRAHMFETSTGRWRGVTTQPRQQAELAYHDSLAAIALKKEN